MPSCYGRLIWREAGLNFRPYRTGCDCTEQPPPGGWKLQWAHARQGVCTYRLEDPNEEIAGRAQDHLEGGRVHGRSMYSLS